MSRKTTPKIRPKNTPGGVQGAREDGLGNCLLGGEFREEGGGRPSGRRRDGDADGLLARFWRYHGGLGYSCVLGGKDVLPPAAEAQERTIKKSLGQGLNGRESIP